jgi:hypothetical protein
MKAECMLFNADVLIEKNFVIRIFIKRKMPYLFVLFAVNAVVTKL